MNKKKDASASRLNANHEKRRADDAACTASKEKLELAVEAFTKVLSKLRDAAQMSDSDLDEFLKNKLTLKSKSAIEDLKFFLDPDRRDLNKTDSLTKERNALSTAIENLVPVIEHHAKKFAADAAATTEAGAKAKADAEADANVHVDTDPNAETQMKPETTDEEARAAVIKLIEEGLEEKTARDTRLQDPKYAPFQAQYEAVLTELSITEESVQAELWHFEQCRSIVRNGTNYPATLDELNDLRQETLKFLANGERFEARYNRRVEQKRVADAAEKKAAETARVEAEAKKAKAEAVAKANAEADAAAKAKADAEAKARTAPTIVEAAPRTQRQLPPPLPVTALARQPAPPTLMLVPAYNADAEREAKEKQAREEADRVKFNDAVTHLLTARTRLIDATGYLGRGDIALIDRVNLLCKEYAIPVDDAKTLAHDITLAEQVKTGKYASAIPAQVLRDAGTHLWSIAEDIRTRREAKAKEGKTMTNPPADKTTVDLFKAHNGMVHSTLTTESAPPPNVSPELIEESKEILKKVESVIVVDMKDGFKAALEATWKYNGFKLPDGGISFFSAIAVLDETVKGTKHQPSQIQSALEECNKSVNAMFIHATENIRRANAPTLEAKAPPSSPPPSSKKTVIDVDAEMSETEGRMEEAANKEPWLPKWMVIMLFIAIAAVGVLAVFLYKVMNVDEEEKPAKPIASAHKPSASGAVSGTGTGHKAPDVPHGRQPMSQELLDQANQAWGARGGIKCWHAKTVDVKAGKPYVDCDTYIYSTDLDGSKCYDVSNCVVIMP